MEVTTNHTDAVLNFSLGLLCIVVLAVVVLLFNHRRRVRLDERSEFETERLYFAATVLAGLGIIFLESMAMYYWSSGSPDTGKEIFDACKTVIPPIATLVLGYYFGKSEQREQERKQLK